MAGLIVIRGNSGRGKTSLAREVQRRLGGLLISQDVVRREMLRAKDGPGTPALPLMQALLRYGAAHCERVILEGILDAGVYRPLFVLGRELFGDRICACYYDIPFEETLRRHQTKPNCADFGEAEMWRWWKPRDLSDVLDERILTTDVSLDAAAGRICDIAMGWTRG